MAVNPIQLALQNAPALKALGYTVEPDGKVSQNSVIGKQYVPPSTWMTQLPSSGFKTADGQGINPNFDFSGVDSTEPAKGFAVSGQFDPQTGETNNSVNWGNLGVTGLVGGTAALAALPLLGVGGSAASPGAAGAEGDAAGLADAGATTASGGADVTGGVAGAGAGGGVPLTGPGSTGYVQGPGIAGMENASGGTDWLKAAGDVGQALGAAGSGAASGRNADNTANINYANAQNTLYKTQLGAPGQIAGNAVRGDILSNARDVSIAAPSDIPQPQISGGLRPSMFSPTTRALGSSITANAAATPLPIATSPVLQPMETAGAGSDILNTAGVIGNLVKAIGPSNLAKIGSSIGSWFNNG